MYKSAEKNRRVVTSYLRYLVCISAFLALCPQVVVAVPTIETRVDPQRGTVSDVYTLVVSLSGDEAGDAEAPSFAEDENFEISQLGVSTSHEIFNGRQSSSVDYNFLLKPKRKLPAGRYRTPSGLIDLGSAKLQVPMQVIEIVEAAVGATAQESNDEIYFMQQVDNKSPYLGEQVLYEVRFNPRRITLYDAKLEDAIFIGLRREDLGNERDRKYEDPAGGVTIVRREVIFPTEVGKKVIPERALYGQVKVPTGMGRMGRTRSPLLFNDPFSMFDRYQLQEKRYLTEPVELNVRPLPPLPEGVVLRQRSIPVGELTFALELDRDRVEVGSNVSLKLRITGDANLRVLELDAPTGVDGQHFKVYQDKPSVKVSYNGRRLTSEFTLVSGLVPLKSGELLVPQYRVVYFSPRDGQYRVHNTPMRKLTVVPAADADKLQLSTGRSGAGNTASGKLGDDSEHLGVDKKVVDILGSDLFPLVIDDRLFAHRRSVDPKLVLAFVVVCPFLVTLLGWRFRRLHLLFSDIKEVESRRALALAMSQLQGEISVDSLSQVLFSYIQKRFKVVQAGLTAEVAESIVKCKISDETALTKLREVLGALDRYRYGGAGVERDKLQKIAEQIREVISALDRAKLSL